MKAFRSVAYAGVIIGLAAFISRANHSIQDKPQSVIGLVVQTDGGGKTLTIRTDADETVVVQTDGKTTILRIPAGERG